MECDLIFTMDTSGIKFGPGATREVGAVGFGPDDVPVLVAGTLPQHRVVKLTPRSVGETDLEQLFTQAMTCWEE